MKRITIALIVWALCAPVLIVDTADELTQPQYPAMPQLGTTDVAPNVTKKQATQPAETSTDSARENAEPQPAEFTTADVVTAIRNEMADQETRVAETGAPLNPSTELTREANGRSVWQMVGQMLMSLALVITLALGFAWVMRKYVLKNRTLGGSYIEVMASFAISQKSTVHLIRAGNEHFLIGEGGNSITLISPVESLGQSAPSEERILDEPDPLLDPVTSGKTNGDSPLVHEPNGTSFQDRLSSWQQSLDNQNLSQEVKTSLLMLSGLSERLRRKGGDGNG